MLVDVEASLIELDDVFPIHDLMYLDLQFFNEVRRSCWRIVWR